MKGTNVDVITCTGSDLLSFEAFITKHEKNRVGWDSGFFKVVVDPSTPRQTPTSVILEQVTKNLEKVEVQIVLQGAAENIYQCKFSAASTYNIERFKNIGLDSFNQEECCSQELKTDTNLLVAQFFSDIVKSSTRYTIDPADCNERKSRFLKEGEKLRQLYEEDRLELQCAILDISSDICPCPDCTPAPMPRQSTSQKNCILYGNGIVLKNTGPILITQGFSLSTIKNILNIGHYYEGLSCPFFYMGTKNSFFPLHVEDGLLWSINYLHFGSPKIWIMIPPRATLLLNYHLWKSGLALGNTSCWNILGHKTVLPSIQWLEERLIPFEVVVQNPGDAIILYPNTAHCGFNTGWNIAEAINFGTVSWIPEGINAPKCQCLRKQVHLDMTIFVAAFMPELLDKFLARKFIETPRSLSSITFFHETITNLIRVGFPKSMDPETDCSSLNVKKGHHRNLKKARSIQAKLQCPAPFCNVKYPISQSGALFTHVVNNHRPIVGKCKLLEKVDELLRGVKKH